MIEITPAGPDDADAFVGLESRLFAEDGGVHDPHADVTWPEREGHDDFRQLLDDPGSIVLLAWADDRAVGMTAGYTSRPGSTRNPILSGVLRSMYVHPDHRRDGVAGRLVEAFLAWAEQQGCVEVFVDCYAANGSARGLYESHGFRPQSISHVIRFPRTDPVG